jgi:hypothetical protein
MESTPAILYHASWNSTIYEFDPRQESIRDPDEGPVVFATPDKAYASCFMVPSDDSWVKVGQYSVNDPHEPWKIIISDEDRFRELDNGGVIYHLPSKSFTCHAERNSGELEWTSTQKVKPVTKEFYKSGLEAMQKLGVTSYFVDQRIFTAIKSFDAEGKDIIDTLRPVR